jgi:arylformamidase
LRVTADNARTASSDAAFAERQYNLRAAFPDHAQWFARWAADSAKARAALRTVPDVRYGPGRKQTIDLFPAERPRGALLFIHGGYWRALDKDDHSFIAPPFVADGIGVAVLNYDLCPEVSVARIVEECREAVDWLRREGASHGVSAKRMIVGGHSAGGHLTAMMFATDWKARGSPGDPVLGGVSISGVFELEPLVDVSFNADLGLDRQSARELSPALLVPRVDAQLLLAAGADETQEFVRQSRAIWDSWPSCRPAGSTGPLLVPGKHHFSVLSELADPQSALFSRTMGLF